MGLKAFLRRNKPLVMLKVSVLSELGLRVLARENEAHPSPVLEP